MIGILIALEYLVLLSAAAGIVIRDLILRPTTVVFLPLPVPASTDPPTTAELRPYANCGRCKGTGILGGWQGRCPQCGGTS